MKLGMEVVLDDVMISVSVSVSESMSISTSRLGKPSSRSPETVADQTLTPGSPIRPHESFLRKCLMILRCHDVGLRGESADGGSQRLSRTRSVPGTSSASIRHVLCLGSVWLWEHGAESEELAKVVPAGDDVQPPQKVGRGEREEDRLERGGTVRGMGPVV